MSKIFVHLLFLRYRRKSFCSYCVGNEEVVRRFKELLRAVEQNIQIREQ